MLNVYKSGTKTLPTAGTSGETFQLSFLPTQGPRGGRNVIARLWLVFNVQVDTDASTTIAAGGWCNFLSRLLIRVPGYTPVDLSGPQLRVLDYLWNGRQAVADPSALAAGQSNATRTIKIPVHFKQRRAKSHFDFCLPVDTLRKLGDGSLQIWTNGPASIGTGGGTTVDSVSCYLVAECREERDLIARNKRELKAYSSANTTDHQVPISGGWIRSLVLAKYADHATGCDNISSIASVTIPAWGVQEIDPDTLRDSYIAETNADAASSSDPMVQTTERAIVLVNPFDHVKVTELLTHKSDMQVKLNSNSVANLPFIMEQLFPMDEASMAVELEYAAKYGLAVRTVKTAGKTKRDPKGWDSDIARLLPNKLS